MATRRSLLIWLSYFLLSNALLFCMIAGLNLYTLNLLHNIDIRVGGVIFVYFFNLIATLGHMSLLSAIPVALIIVPLSLLLPNRRLIVFVSSILISLELALMLTDHYTFSLFRFHLQGLIWQLLLSPARKEIFALSYLEQYLLIGGLITLVSLEYLWGSFVWHRVKHKVRFPSAAIITVCGCLLISYLFYLSSVSAIMQTPKGALTMNAISQQARAIPLYSHILSKLSPSDTNKNGLFLHGRGFIRQPEQAQSTLQYPLQPLRFGTPPKPLNVLFLVIDAWRYDTLNNAVTPHITEFSKKTWEFQQHYSGGNATRPGIFSLFYGIPSSYWSSMLAAGKAPILMQTLLKRGYQFSIHGSASLSMPEFDKTVFVDLPNIKTETPGDLAYQRDAIATNELLDFIRKRTPESPPFFGFLFLDSAHSSCQDFKFATPFKPYTEPCNRLMYSENSDPLPILNRYKNALHYDDGLIGSVLSTLKTAGLDNNTLVLITADHGEEFNDNHHNYWGHSSNYTDVQIKVPLLIYWPGHKHHTFTKQTSHYDIAPSLMTWLFAATTPAQAYSVGTILTKPHHPEFLLIGSYVGYGILTENRIVNVYPSGDYQIVNQHADQLPGEQLNSHLLSDVFMLTQRFYKRIT